MPLPEPYYTSPDGRIVLYCADCRDVLAHLPAADLLLTDPPYGIANGVFWRRNGTILSHDRDARHNVRVDGWRDQVRLANPAAIVEFCNGQLAALDAVRSAHRQAGWQEWRLYVLAKATPPPSVRPTFASSFEVALVSYCGRRPWYGGHHVPDSWHGITPNAAGCGVHPTQKPLTPIRRLIEALCPPHGLVLDPFAGSGTTLVAAQVLGRRAIGVEIEERYCGIAVERLRQQPLPLPEPEPVRQPALMEEDS